MHQFSKKHLLSKLKVNKVIWILTFSDIFTWGSSTILNGLTGLYIASKLGEHAVGVIGITVTIYFITRAIVQLPVGMVLDKIKSDRDEIFVLATGSILAGLPFVLYPLASLPYQFYLLHFVFGLGVSLNLNAWRKLFAKNIDKDKEGLDYAMYETMMSLGAAFFSFMGGELANVNEQYFNWVISGAGIITMLSSFWAIMLFTVANRKSART